jgi:hypothetical protein
MRIWSSLRRIPWLRRRALARRAVQSSSLIRPGMPGLRGLPVGVYVRELTEAERREPPPATRPPARRWLDRPPGRRWWEP